jgi:hypothetical protein
MRLFSAADISIIIFLISGRSWLDWLVSSAAFPSCRLWTLIRLFNLTSPTTQHQRSEPTVQHQESEPTTQHQQSKPTTQHQRSEPTVQHQQPEPTTQIGGQTDIIGTDRIRIGLRMLTDTDTLTYTDRNLTYVTAIIGVECSRPIVNKTVFDHDKTYNIWRPWSQN